MSDVKRYTAVGDGVVKTNPAGPLVEYTDYARLKAEVERLTDENVSIRMERMQDETGKRITYADYAELKAEVERLRKFNDEALAHIAKEERKSRERLDIVQAEADSLIKAGDKLAGVIGLPVNDVQTNALVEAWNAAKEGKQS